MAVLLHVFLVATLFSLAAAAANTSSQTVPAVFVFGDSLVDTGNNNYIPTLAKSNFPPYGRDFPPGGQPNGRFTNGKCVSDFIAEALGVKELLPPYLAPHLDLQQLLTGVCFASGGAGYDPRTSQLTTAIPILGQLDMLREYIRKINSSVGQERTASIISESAYITFLGSNDITNPLLSSLYDEESHTDLIIRQALHFYKKLYEVGARRIGLLGLPPTGCVPGLRFLDGGLKRVCSESVNRRIRLFNSKLSLAVDKMNEELPGARIVIFDLYNPLLSLIQNPAPYGIEEVKRGCCGTGNLELGPLCAIPGTCPDASKYLFWDTVHPTDKASKILTYQALTPNLSKLF
ncbi:GDSL esterase/lipase At3g14820 [Linum grandiflorum]